MTHRETTAITAVLPTYRGATFALLTQHGKEVTMGARFEEAWHARVEIVRGFDTDTLGTFTRDIPRDGSQLEAARKKARLGMALSGLPFGLASEGAFGSGPFGLYALNLELVVLIDAMRGIEIVGRSQKPGLHGHATVRTRAEIEDFARRYGFPEHGLVLRPNADADPRIRKGLRTWDALLQAFTEAQNESTGGAVFIENDLRAHMNPTRMSNIGAATDDLIARTKARCAVCDSPGFGLAASVSGLPCNDCRMPSPQARALRLECVACGYRETRELPLRFADPTYCQHCNP